MLILISLILLGGLIYFIWKTIEYRHLAMHNSYLRCLGELKKIEEEYTNGKYDFLTYKCLKEQILKSHDLPKDYKEES